MRYGATATGHYRHLIYSIGDPVNPRWGQSFCGKALTREVDPDWGMQLCARCQTSWACGERQRWPRTDAVRAAGWEADFQNSAHAPRPSTGSYQ